METSRTRPRSGHMTRQLVITIGGEIYNKNYLNSVDCYNVDRGQWTRLKELPFPRCHHGAALYESSIIYVAGVHPGCCYKKLNVVKVLRRGSWMRASTRVRAGVIAMF